VICDFATFLLWHVSGFGPLPFILITTTTTTTKYVLFLFVMNSGVVTAQRALWWSWCRSLVLRSSARWRCFAVRQQHHSRCGRRQSRRLGDNIDTRSRWMHSKPSGVHDPAAAELGIVVWLRPHWWDFNSGGTQERLPGYLPSCRDHSE